LASRNTRIYGTVQSDILNHIGLGVTNECDDRHIDERTDSLVANAALNYVARTKIIEVQYCNYAHYLQLTWLTKAHTLV